MVGGALEYGSMAWGINNLNLLCLAAYASAAVFAYARFPVPRPEPVTRESH